MNLLPATARAATSDDEPISFVPVGHLFPPCVGTTSRTKSPAWSLRAGISGTASYFVHTGVMPLPPPPPWDADPVTWSTWVRDHVTAVFAPLRRAVGLR